MRKVEFYLKAIKTSAILKKHWGMSVYSVAKDIREIEPYPYCIRRQTGGVYFHDPENDMQLTLIDDADLNEPVARFRDKITLPAGHLDNAPEEVVTTWGSVYVNQLTLCLPFKGEIPFENGFFNNKKIEKIIFEKLTTDPDDVEDPSDPTFFAPPGKIYVRQYKMYGTYIQSLVMFNSLSVHSITPKSLLYHPGAQKLKEELMERFKDQLNDPAIVARIGKAMEELDREWLKDDPSMDFYLKPKYFTTVRKKLHYMFGAESAFTDGSTVEFLPQALKDGIDIEKLPEMINSLREGSYNRGALTELGGAATKEVYRAMSTVTLEGDDCGSTLGVTRKLYPHQRSTWIGCNIIENGKVVKLTEDNIDRYLGATVVMRGPLYCKADGVNFCRTCMGDPNTFIEHGLPAAAANTTTTLMYVFMSAMHGQELKTVEFDMDRLIS